MRKRLGLIGSLLVLAILLAPIAVAEKPFWAKEGNWVKYETELTMEGQALQLVFGTTRLTVKEVVELKIVSVNDTGFQALAKILEYHVEPKELEKKMENAALKTKTIYVRFNNKPGSEPLFYADPKQLPPNGVVKAGLEESPITAIYDTKTGWLLEAHANTTKQGVTTTLHMVLLDSNFVKKNSKNLGGAESKANMALILSLAGVAATIAIIAMLIIRKHR